MACLFQKPTKGQDGTLRDQSRKKMPIFLREKNSFGQQLIVYNFLGKNVDFLQMQLPITFSHQIQLTAISRKKITSFLGLAFSRLAILAFFLKY